ncbi:MAG: hypothetical protein Q9160_003900 [Pyrenula sp. 1 TL-2023]
MANIRSFDILSYLTLFVLARSDSSRDIVSDHELRLPYICPTPLLSGSSSYKITLPQPYSSIIPIISNFASVDWEYDLTNASFPPQTQEDSVTPPSNPPPSGHYNEATDTYVPAIPVTLNAFTPVPGSTRFYTLPHTSITIVETLQAIDTPPIGPFNLVHTLAPIYLPLPLNLTIGSPFSSTSAIPVCNDLATQLIFNTDFCASNPTNATSFLNAKSNGASTALQRLLGGQNLTSCEDLQEMPAEGQKEPNAADMAKIAPLRPSTAEQGVAASKATTLWPQPTTWSDHHGGKTLHWNVTGGGSSGTYKSTVAWWKMFGAASAVATAGTMMP